MALAAIMELIFETSYSARFLQENARLYRKAVFKTRHVMEIESFWRSYPVTIALTLIPRR